MTTYKTRIATKAAKSKNAKHLQPPQSQTAADLSMLSNGRQLPPNPKSHNHPSVTNAWTRRARCKVLHRGVSAAPTTMRSFQIPPMIYIKILQRRYRMTKPHWMVPTFLKHTPRGSENLTTRYGRPYVSAGSFFHNKHDRSNRYATN